MFKGGRNLIPAQAGQGVQASGPALTFAGPGLKGTWADTRHEPEDHPTILTFGTVTPLATASRSHRVGFYRHWLTPGWKAVRDFTTLVTFAVLTGPMID